MLDGKLKIKLLKSLSELLSYLADSEESDNKIDKYLIEEYWNISQDIIENLEKQLNIQTDIVDNNKNEYSEIDIFISVNNLIKSIILLGDNDFENEEDLISLVFIQSLICKDNKYKCKQI